VVLQGSEEGEDGDEDHPHGNARGEQLEQLPLVVSGGGSAGPGPITSAAASAGETDTGATAGDTEEEAPPDSPMGPVVAEYSPLQDLRGQTGRLWSFALLSYQVSAIRLSFATLLTLLARWPAQGPPFSIDMLGSFESFWKFLFLTYRLERSTTGGQANGSRLSSRGLLDKLCPSTAAASAFVVQLLRRGLSELTLAVGRVPQGVAVQKTFETPHPYHDNMDTHFVIHLPGAKRIKVTTNTYTQNGTKII
jgi:hypothetical protein